MPFILQERRDRITCEGLNSVMPVQPGDLCYVYYKVMVNRWNASPRWTTAHELFKEVITYEVTQTELDEGIARLLAWQVFFQLHVMPYELKKREENGDI